MTSAEEQASELEVLLSIYDGDDAFKKVSDTRLQYRIDGAHPFVVEIEWPPEYPAVRANISLDVFFNSHISTSRRDTLRDALIAVAEENVGMAVSFLLFEYAKERADELTSEWANDLAAASAATANSSDAARADQKNEGPQSKAAKRKMWDRVVGGGGAELARGHDWVCILKHLSQTGSAVD